MDNAATHLFVNCPKLFLIIFDCDKFLRAFGILSFTLFIFNLERNNKY